MKKIKCIIVDDEPLAVQLLQNYVMKIPFLELVFTSDNPVTVLEYIQSNEADLVFLDIQMPQLSGINLMKIAGEQLKYVLTTAYSEYALEGYDHDVIDYLLKPISFERFKKSTMKAQEYYQIKKPENSYFFVKSSGQQNRLNFDDIGFIESIKDYVSINTDKQEYIVLETLKSLENQLPQQFVRVHKSFIINLAKIQIFEGKNIQLISGKTIPIGETYRPDFLLKIKNRPVS